MAEILLFVLLAGAFALKNIESLRHRHPIEAVVYSCGASALGMGILYGIGWLARL